MKFVCRTAYCTILIPGTASLQTPPPPLSFLPFPPKRTLQANKSLFIFFPPSKTEIVALFLQLKEDFFHDFVLGLINIFLTN